MLHENYQIIFIMKRYTNYFSKLVEYDNILLAIKKATKHDSRDTSAQKRAKKYAITHIEEVAKDIQTQFITEKYKTYDYFVFPLLEPKLRFIYSLVRFNDRIAQHAIMNVLEPLFDKIFIYHSYSCRKKKGQHKAGGVAGVYAKRYKYCIKGDFSKFYINIPHRLLKQTLRTKIKDTEMLKLLDGIIDSISSRDRNIEELKKLNFKHISRKTIDIELQKLQHSIEVFGHEPAGVPIGNLLSQWFGNMYLTPFDRYITDVLGIGSYVRYCDDFCIFSNDKEKLKDTVDKLHQYAFNKLHLELSKANILKTTQGIDFLGFRYFHSGKVLLRKATAKKDRRHLKKILPAMYSGKISVDTAMSRIGSMRGHLKWGHTHNFQKAIHIDEIDKEVRNAKILGLCK